MKIIIAFDNDEAGKKAALRAKDMMDKEGIENSILEIPAPYKDPDDVIRKDPELWKKLIAEHTTTSATSPRPRLVFPGLLRKQGTHEYTDEWKFSHGYIDKDGIASDEECDWWEEQKRDHLEKLETSMPRTDRALRRLFGLLNVFERRELDKEEVKERVDMRQLLHNYGVGSSTSSSQRIFKCPFHDDRSPSFSVDFRRKLWNCHAGCGGGDCFSLVMRFEDCSFVEALNILNDTF